LTEGKPKLIDAVAAPGASEVELLLVASAVEQHSDHPLAAAIVDGARERLGDRLKLPPATEVKSITGRGISALVDGEAVHIGKPVLFSELPDSALPAAVAAANEQLVATGRTTMVVRQGNRFLGVLGVMDTPRPVAAQVMLDLRQLGIERLIMISGDNQAVADAVAKTVGLTEARGDLMPEQKVEAINQLRAAAWQGGHGRRRRQRCSGDGQCHGRHCHGCGRLRRGTRDGRCCIDGRRSGATAVRRRAVAQQ
jgi:Cd2+/Zn2+-exporting ATPase